MKKNMSYIMLGIFVLTIIVVIACNKSDNEPIVYFEAPEIVKDKVEEAQEQVPDKLEEIKQAIEERLKAELPDLKVLDNVVEEATPEPVEESPTEETIPDSTKTDDNNDEGEE